MFDHVGADDVVEDTLVGKLEGEIEVALMIISEFLAESFSRSGVDARHAYILFEQRPREQAIRAAEVEYRASLRDRGDDLNVGSGTRALQRIVDVVVDQVSAITGEVDLVKAVADRSPTGEEIVKDIAGVVVVVPAIAIDERYFVYRDTERAQLENDLGVE